MFGADYWLYLSVVVSFVFGMIAMPFYLKFLKKMQVQQYLREDGPKSHAHKANTPTTGGVVFIFSSLVGLIIWTLYFQAKLAQAQASQSAQTVLTAYDHPSAWFVFLAAFACALLGFADDYAKVREKSNKGVSPRARLIVEALIGALLALALLSSGPINVYLPGWSVLGVWFAPHAMPPLLAIL